MHTLSCHYRDHLITARVETHPGLITPYAGGCAITDPDGHTGRRMPLPYSGHFMADLNNAQRASLAHGRWLVDQKLDHPH
ncbi:hypothetical protein ACLUUI_06835 [Enterobacterales bacterium AW_CKDN230030176-1A_HGKHYDSX7]